MNNVLIIGNGSIGKQYAEIFNEFSDYDVHDISNRLAIENILGGKNTEEKISQKFIKNLKYAIVASPAPYHIEQVKMLLENDVPVLIEKPLSNHKNTCKDLIQSDNFIGRTGVGYLLRFSQLYSEVKKKFDNGYFGRPINIQVNTGQYLPSWRKNIDYRDSVSAQLKLGGGVLLELSHEFDLMMALFGKPRSLISDFHNSSTLEIDVEDTADILFNYECGVRVNMHIDMLQRWPVREWNVITDKGQVLINFTDNSLRWKLDNNATDSIVFNDDKKTLLSRQLTDFENLIQEGRWQGATFKNGYEVLSLIDAIKDSYKKRAWVDICYE